MSYKRQFVPASIEAFKRTARDIQQAYPLSLQQSQEVLAKVYGYPDFHALQEHFKTNPTPGPFLGDTGGVLFSFSIDAMSRFYQLAGKNLPKGRLDIDDLGIFYDPETRKEIMDFEAEVDAAVKGVEGIETKTPTSDYVWFEETDVFKDPLFTDRIHHEGVFRLTRKGAVIFKAMNWFYDQVAEGRAGEDLVARLDRLLDAHPNNPYTASMRIFEELEPYGDEDKIPADLANEMWPIAKASRALFESVMPPKFRGRINPKLISKDASNKYYFALLYWGAVCAAALGFERGALAWARRSLKFDRADSFGAKFIVEQFAKK